jgi:hypothetical protein
MLTKRTSSSNRNGTRSAVELPAETACCSPRDRMTEIAELLALAVSRMQARKASELSDHTGDSSLDTSAHQSGHPTFSKRRTTDA